jgi:hypothetical protein
MTKADELLALAIRCEQATGPDREIDRDIGLMLGLYDNPEDLGCFDDTAEAVVGGGGQTFAPPAFTASLDAAMTLVPEGWSGTATKRANGKGLAEVDRPGSLRKVSWAATPALALCAAVLRARAASQ